jgi:hypothetical protein
MLRLNIEDRVLPVKEGNNEIQRGRQKKRLFADVLRILKAYKSLSGTLDWKGIDISELGIIHEKDLR